MTSLRSRRILPAVGLVLFVLLIGWRTNADTNHFEYSELLITMQLQAPTAMAVAPDGRIFVAEQSGAIRIVKGGRLLWQPFADLNLPDPVGSEGLIGIAVPPDFVSVPYIYIHYTTPESPSRHRISRFPAQSDVTTTISEEIILDLTGSEATPQNPGGALAFGHDGKLYIGIGDEGNGSNSRTLDNPAGKVLRINPDGTIPVDNPFYNQTTGENRTLWARGLQNPTSLAFDTGSNRFYIHDVSREYLSFMEINRGVAGEDYGWNTAEGYTSDPRFRSPVYAYYPLYYPSCPVTSVAGVFYRSQTAQFPSEFVGDYLFTDFCQNTIRSYDPQTGISSFFLDHTDAFNLIDLDAASDGSLYYLEFENGALYQIVGEDTSIPPSIALDTPLREIIAYNDEIVEVICDATGTAPMQLVWKRNGNYVSDSYDGVLRLNSHVADDGDHFQCIAYNFYGETLSDEILVNVDTSPQGSIVAPAINTKVVPGQVISYSAEGTDDEDGNLSSAAYTWSVEERNNQGIVRTLPATQGQEGTFTIPPDDFSPSHFYRLLLTVSDSAAQSVSRYVDLYPAAFTVTIGTDLSNISGYAYKVDGNSYTQSTSQQWTVGTQHTVHAISPLLDIYGNRWDFVAWSNGGDMEHTITTPSANTTYTAHYTSNDDFSIPMPINLFPATNTTVTTLASPQFAWGASNGAESYQIQIDQHSDFSSPEIDSVMTQTEYGASTLLQYTELYWRVRALGDDGELSGWTPIRTIQWNPTQRPNLLLPADEGSFTSEEPPLLDWTDVEGVQSYHLQVDDQSDFSSPYLDGGVGTTSARQLSVLLPSSVSIYWRVRTINQYQEATEWTEVHSFTWHQILKAPTLLAPATNQSTSNSFPPTFAWLPVPTASRYQIQVDDQSDFSSPFVDAETTAQSYTPANLFAGTIYWRVRAMKADIDPSAWSEIRAFTIYSYLSDVPGLNVLITTQPTVSWSRITWATHYELEVSTDPQFATVTYRDTNIVSDTLSVSVPGLSDGTYYWRVRAYEDRRIGAWSATGEFTLNVP